VKRSCSVVCKLVACTSGIDGTTHDKLLSIELKVAEVEDEPSHTQVTVSPDTFLHCPKIDTKSPACPLLDETEVMTGAELAQVHG
jgi:hypothetical protein